jgi:hypothetical protein
MTPKSDIKYLTLKKSLELYNRDYLSVFKKQLPDNYFDGFSVPNLAKNYILDMMNHPPIKAIDNELILNSLLKYIIDRTFIITGKSQFENKKKDVTKKVQDAMSNIFTFIECKEEDEDGNVASSKIYDVFLDIIFADINTHFSHLTIWEIRNALGLGARGEYGNFYNISPAELFKWLKRYVLVTRNEIVGIYNKIKNKKQNIEPEKTFTTEEEAKIHRNYLSHYILSIDEYISGKRKNITILDRTGCFYEYLAKVGIIEKNAYLKYIDNSEQPNIIDKALNMNSTCLAKRKAITAKIYDLKEKNVLLTNEIKRLKNILKT